MKKIVGLLLIIFMTLFVIAEEDFDNFDDEESSFVIKTKKPKIMVKKDSIEEKEAVKFDKESEQSNKAVSMSVKNFLIFSKLKDIDARYLVMELSLKNILKPQKVIVSEGSNHPANWVTKSSDDYEYKEAIPLYQIPDMMQHLYLRVNNEQEKPIDIMSLLVDRPLIDFDSNTVEVLPEKLKEGQLAFRLAKGEKIDQLSLHYYDTKYGNINLPIIGEMKAKTVDVTTLPKTAWKKMNDNFALSVTGYDSTDKIGKNEANEDGQFEIVEIDIESKVYALLQFNPAERFYLKVGDTHRLKLHPITQALPMGLYSSASLSPGSNNKFRLAFYVPKGMEKLSRSLMVELQGEDIVLPIKKGEDGSEKTVLAKGSVEGTDLEINGVYLHDDMMLIDVTFNDKTDAYSTRLHDGFYLNREPKMPNTSSRKMVRDLTGEDISQSSGMGNFTHSTYKSVYSWYNLTKSSDKILGYKNKEVILDGNKKRVFLWFANQFSKEYTKPWYLVSPIFKDLKFKIEKEPKALPESLKYFLAKSYPYKYQSDGIERKVLAMVKTFRAKKAKEQTVEDREKQLIAKLESKKEKSKYITIPPISASSYGEDKLAKIKSTQELIEELKKLEWVPASYNVTSAIYSTPAILTQSWATENEMFKAIYNRVKDNDVKFGSYTLSNEGEKELKKEAKNIPLREKIPFIEWTKEGKKHSLVLPFLKPINEVKKYISAKEYLKEIEKKQATIEMKLTYIPKSDGSATSSFGMFGGALGGATTDEQEDMIFKHSWNLDEISDTPVDIYFPKTTAFCIDHNGTHQDTNHALSAKKVEPKVLTINITMPDGKLDTYEHHFRGKQELKDVFFTFALATPDISKNIINQMEEKRKQLFKGKNIKKINAFSLIQWSNRAKIYKFISLQTFNEKYLEEVLKVKAKRNTTPRAIMTMIEKRPDKNLVSSIDLRRVFNDVYGDKNATNAFNIMSGIFNAEAEAKVIPRGKGIFEYWQAYKNPQMVLINNRNKDKAIESMKQNNINANIIARLEKSDKIWMFPLNQKKNIGWLEINPQNYQTVSVFENGQYAAMTEAEILQSIKDIVGYGLGLFKGVETSVFSVITYSLESSNSCDILKKAEALANKIACAVASLQFATGSIGSNTTANIGGGAGTVLGCIGQGGASKAVTWGTALARGRESGTKGVSETLGGFANGFGDGVALYFIDAKSKSSCK